MQHQHNSLQQSRPASEPPSSTPRVLAGRDLLIVTGVIHDFECHQLYNRGQHKPILMINPASPRVFSLKFGQSRIMGPEAGVIPVDMISGSTCLTLRDLLIQDDVLIQAIRSTLAPVTRIKAHHLVDEGVDYVSFGVCIGGFQHTFVEKLENVRELTLA